MIEIQFGFCPEERILKIQPPPSAIELAQALAADTAERGMVYEEYTFEVEDGPEDGCEYKVLVMRI